MLLKSKSWILIGVLLAALTAAAAAQVVTTTVADTIYHADGTPATGTAIISWPAFTTSAGDVVPTGNTSATIAAGGALSVQLAPNAGATPIGTYYTVVYHLDDGTLSRQYWVVPASAAAVKVSAVESTVMPASVAMQTVSKSYVDTAIAAAVSGHPLDQSPFVQKTGDTMTGPLLLPADPVSAAQAADKHYVDASVAAISGGMGQGGAAPPQTQYMVPAYLLSPAAGLASPGPTHLWVDPTGYNLNGYGAGFTSLGVTPGNQGDCTQVGGLFGGHSCLGLSSTYNGYAYGDQIHWGTVNSFTALGAGSYLGNDGVGRQDTAATILSNTLVRGTHVSDERALFGSAVGDWDPLYIYDFDSGGLAAPSDEGITVAGTYEGGESYGYAHFFVATGGPGATTPTFTSGGTGCGNFNLCNPIDGGILLDTQTAAASGYLNSQGAPWSAASAVPLQTIAVAGVTLPTTAAWGYANGVSIVPATVRNAPVPETVALTMVTGSFSAGDHVCVEGTAAMGGWDEQSIISGVSGGSVTLPLAYPYTNIAIFKGGPCGTYISFSANLALSGYRTTYHAIASFTGSDLIYASPSGSGLNGAIQGTLPQAGVEPETHGGPSDPNAAFQTFCGAEIIANLSTGNTPQIDPNGCAWAPGDTVESPHFPTQGVNGMFLVENQDMPNSTRGTTGITLQIGGMGMAGDVQGYFIDNVTPDAWYTSGGGKLTPPQCAFCAAGTWLDGLRMTAPSGSLIRVSNHLPGQTGYNIFSDTMGGFGGVIGLDAAGFHFSNSVSTTAGFSGGAVSVTGAISSQTMGSTASATIVNGALPDQTPSFTQAGYLGSSAEFGGVGMPGQPGYPAVTPLLNIATNYGGAQGGTTYGWWLDSYNSSGAATPVVFAESGPGVIDTNLTLENGTTHCATLLCLGPNASVDSAGNAVVRNLNVLGVCTGCGSGSGGGGGVNGSGTAGYLPAFAGSTALGNSHIDDGATTAGVITATEQLNVNTGGSPYGAIFNSSSTNATVLQLLNTSGGAHSYEFFSGGSATCAGGCFGVYDLGGPGSGFQLSIGGGAAPQISTVAGGGFTWWPGTSPAAPDTGLSRESAGVVDVGNGTAGDKSGTLNAAAVSAGVYKGPATAPTGACSVVGWAFSQDGHASFCNGSVWATKI